MTMTHFWKKQRVTEQLPCNKSIQAVVCYWQQGTDNGIPGVGKGCLSTVSVSFHAYDDTPMLAMRGSLFFANSSLQSCNSMKPPPANAQLM